jgi:two-component system sensor histidine kinase PilS (NtrC family)
MASSLEALHWLRPPEHGAPERWIDRIKWATLTRVLAVTALLVFAMVMDLGMGPQPATQVPEKLLYQLTTSFYLLSLALLVAAAVLRDLRNLRVLAWLSVVLDIALSLSVVTVTGGLDSLFLFAFPLSVLNATLLLAGAGAWIVAASTMLGLLVLAADELGWLPLHLANYHVAYLRSLTPPSPMPPYEAMRSVLVHAGASVATAALAVVLSRELERARRGGREHKAAFERLRVRYEDVVSALPDGLLTTDNDGLVTSANPAALRILGARLVAIQLQPLQVVLPELAAAAQQRAPSELEISRITRTQELRRASTTVPIADVDQVASQTQELQRVTAVGQQLLMCRVVPLRDPDGSEAGRLVVLRDVTDQRQAEEAHRTRERLAAIGAMATAVAHEIRNPLASISGSVQMLEANDEVTPEQRSLMTIVVRETHQLSDWIGEFLDFARPRPLQWGRCDLVDLALQTLEACQNDPRVTAASITLGPGARLAALAKGTGADAEVEGDAVLLRQVLWNLLLNACQAVQASTRRRVELDLITEMDRVGIAVRDSGPGIAPEDLPHLFEPFYTTRGEGTGLGLATVQRHVEAHRGEVVAKARAELGGAEFRVWLPRVHGASGFLTDQHRLAQLGAPTQR